MKRFSATLLSACVVISLGATALQVFAADAAPTRDDAVLKDALVKLEQQSWVAWKNRDGAFFAKFLAEDHVEVGAGGIIGKAAVVAFVASPACSVANYTLDKFQVARIGRDTAILTYHAEQQTVCGGVAVPSPVWASSVFVKREGLWVNVLYQQTPTLGK